MRKLLKEFTRKEKLPLLGGMVYCFCIPLPQIVATGALITWLVLTLVGPRKLNEEQKTLMMPFGLFLLYLASFILVPSDEYGILERKLSLLVFPVIFYFSSYTIAERTVLLKSFVSGLTLSGILCFAIALISSIHLVEGQLIFHPEVLAGKGFFESILYGGNYFFGRHFSVFHQTVYYAFYLCVGISTLLFRSDILQSQNSRWSLIAFFALLIFLISNKGSFVAVAGLFSLYILLRTKSPVQKTALIFLLVLGSFAIVKGNPRLNESFNKVVAGDFNIDKNARYGFSTRLLSWDASLNLIKQKPLTGYGVSNAQEALDKEYERKGYKFPLREHLNAHNQFLQFWIESGIAGLILWIMVFVILFIQSRQLSKANRFFAYSFALILFVNSLFESVMNRFSGISFISFAICFLLTNINEKQSH